MNCPIDGAKLQIADRQGVEIDYCPQCRGVWLDRGELDKIIDRADSYDNRDRSRDQPNPQRPASGGVGVNDIAGLVGEVIKGRAQGGQRSGGDNYNRKKKGGILGDIFNF